MGVFVVGEALGLFVVLSLVALVIVRMGRKANNQYAVHGVALAVIVVLMLATSFGRVDSLSRGALSTALVASLLQWTFRLNSKAKPSGAARILAVFLGLASLLALAFVGSAVTYDYGVQSAAECGIAIWAFLVAKFLAFWIWRGFRKAPTTEAAARKSPTSHSV